MKEYKLESKLFEPKKGTEYRTITITDIQLHTAKKNSTKSIGENIGKSIKNGKPGRIYAPIKNLTSSGTTPQEVILAMLRNDPDFVKLVLEEERKGFKVLTALPKEIPMTAGADTIGFIASINGQRILRKKLAKKK